MVHTEQQVPANTRKRHALAERLANRAFSQAEIDANTVLCSEFSTTTRRTMPLLMRGRGSYLFMTSRLFNFGRRGLHNIVSAS